MSSNTNNTGRNNTRVSGNERKNVNRKQNHNSGYNTNRSRNTSNRSNTNNTNNTKNRGTVVTPIEMSDAYQQEMDELLPKLNDIVKESEKINKKRNEMTIQSFHKLTNDINKFIEDKQVLIAGDLAYNASLPASERELEEDEYYTYQFLTPIPNAISVQMAKHLHDTGYQYVRVQRAIIPYTTYMEVDFRPMAYFTYIPPVVYEVLKQDSYEQHHLDYVNPHLLLLNWYEDYIYPWSGMPNWKDDVRKENKIMFQYPFIEPKNKALDGKRVSTGVPHQNELTKLLMEYLSNNEDAMLTGMEGYNILIKESKLKDFETVTDIPCLDIVVKDVSKASTEITELIKGSSNKNISKLVDTLEVKYYKPLLTYLCKRISLVDEHGRCLVNLYQLGNCQNYVTVQNVKVANYHGLIYFYMLQILQKQVDTQFKKEQSNLEQVTSSNKKSNQESNQKGNDEEVESLEELEEVIKNVEEQVGGGSEEETIDFYRALIFSLFMARKTYLEVNDMMGLEESPFQIMQKKCVGQIRNNMFNYRYKQWIKAEEMRFGYRPERGHEFTVREIYPLFDGQEKAQRDDGDDINSDDTTESIANTESTREEQLANEEKIEQQTNEVLANKDKVPLLNAQPPQ